MKISYKYTEYVALVRMSVRKHLLVEGKVDRRLFLLLLNTFKYDLHVLDIDTAEELIGYDGAIGNRERVEIACQSISKLSGNERLIGFVDREFREFDFIDFSDKMPRHNTLGRLVWSRGHSIENYYFDYEMLNRPLFEDSDTDYFIGALDLFKKNLESIIRLACSAGLAGRETGSLSVVRSSVRWEMFRFEKNQISLDTGQWIKILNGMKLTQAKITSIIESYTNWFNKVQKSNYEVVRWMCDGHTGMKYIWAAYGGCVFEVCKQAKYDDPNNQVQKVFRSDEISRFQACAAAWVEKAIGNQTIYPVEVLRLLDLKPVMN